jgi:hypothetical protein
MIMLRNLHNIIFNLFLGVDIYVVATASLIYAILAFVVGIVLLVRKAFVFDEKIHHDKK